MGDFDGLYTFDLVSGKKKKRAFADKGCCIYSNIGGSLIGSMLYFLLMIIFFRKKRKHRFSNLYFLKWINKKNIEVYI